MLINLCLFYFNFEYEVRPFLKNSGPNPETFFVFGGITLGPSARPRALRLALGRSKNLLKYALPPRRTEAMQGRAGAGVSQARETLGRPATVGRTPRDERPHPAASASHSSLTVEAQTSKMLMRVLALVGYFYFRIGFSLLLTCSTNLELYQY